jgi:cytochrome c2
LPSPAKDAASTASDTGDATAGRLVFRKCQACHSLEPGKNMLGPSLGGVLGRKAGTEAGYNYSAAMKAADIVWDPKTLDQYLADPAKVVPGNKMPFPGLKTDHDRADIIAFLAASSAAASRARVRRRPDRRAPRPARRRRHRPAHLRKPLHHRQSVISPMQNIPCAPASPRGAWSTSASGARSKARSILS